MAADGSIQRSAMIHCSRTQSMDKLPDSSSTSGASNSGSGMMSDLVGTYSSYALGSLSSSWFSQLARDTAFVFG